MEVERADVAKELVAWAQAMVLKRNECEWLLFHSRHWSRLATGRNRTGHCRSRCSSPIHSLATCMLVAGCMAGSQEGTGSSSSQSERWEGQQSQARVAAAVVTAVAVLVMVAKAVIAVKVAKVAELANVVDSRGVSLVDAVAVAMAEVEEVNLVEGV